MQPDEQARALVQEFVTALPEARSILDEHLADNFNQLLPHVLMAEFTRWIIGLQRDAHAGNVRAQEMRDRALAFLEAKFSDPADIGGRNVIAASFLENLHQAGSELGALKAQLGPTLRGAMPAT